MHDQQVYKQVAKPPVKLTCTYMERTVHCICFSYHGGVIVSAHLMVSAIWAETVEMQCLCVSEKHTRVSVVGWWTQPCNAQQVRSKSVRLSMLRIKLRVLSAGKIHHAKHSWCGISGKAKNRKAQLHITTHRLLKCSIRETLTFVQGTIGFSVPNVNQNGLE